MAELEIKTEDSFRQIIEAKDSAIKDAIQKAVDEGARVAQATLDTESAARQYELTCEIVGKGYKRSGKFYTAKAFSRKWGHDPFFMRFFEYGTVHIEAMPFMRPGATAMRREFDHQMDYFENTIRGRVRTGLKMRKVV